MHPLRDTNKAFVIIDAVRAYQNEPLDQETKQRILDYLENPAPEGWSDISGILVNSRLLTVWQAVRRIDPSFPATGRRYEFESGRLLKEWERIPEPDLVLDAIRQAQDTYPFAV